MVKVEPRCTQWDLKYKPFKLKNSRFREKLASDLSKLGQIFTRHKKTQSQSQVSIESNPRVVLLSSMMLRLETQRGEHPPWIVEDGEMAVAGEGKGGVESIVRYIAAFLSMNSSSAL